jgi:hypothetical protein
VNETVRQFPTEHIMYIFSTKADSTPVTIRTGLSNHNGYAATCPVDGTEWKVNVKVNCQKRNMGVCVSAFWTITQCRNLNVRRNIHFPSEERTTGQTKYGTFKNSLVFMLHYFQIFKTAYYKRQKLQQS